MPFNNYETIKQYTTVDTITERTPYIFNFIESMQVNIILFGDCIDRCNQYPDLNFLTKRRLNYSVSSTKSLRLFITVDSHCLNG
jgi:glycerol-3-phosphate cytidylyltransferase-like family protein